MTTVQPNKRVVSSPQLESLPAPANLKFLSELWSIKILRKNLHGTKEACDFYVYDTRDELLFFVKSASEKPARRGSPFSLALLDSDFSTVANFTREFNTEQRHKYMGFCGGKCDELRISTPRNDLIGVVTVEQGCFSGRALIIKSQQGDLYNVRNEKGSHFEVTSEGKFVSDIGPRTFSLDDDSYITMSGTSCSFLSNLSIEMKYNLLATALFIDIEWFSKLTENQLKSQEVENLSISSPKARCATLATSIVLDETSATFGTLESLN